MTTFADPPQEVERAESHIGRVKSCKGVGGLHQRLRLQAAYL